ncbi:MAG: hypothetical protein IKF72_05930 [Kiritimatiellae bacterium]|nr:hypothetical protein [Kiritimatiellia bacterium]
MIRDMYDSSTDKKDGGLTYGRAQLIAAKPDAAEEFAAIDRKADKFDLSFGALKDFILGNDDDM